MSATALVGDQRLDALGRANVVKRQRADLRHLIFAANERNGRVLVADAILDPADFLQSLTVRRLLSWIRGWRDARVERFLSSVEIGQRRDLTVGELVPRQRERIARGLTGMR